MEKKQIGVGVVVMIFDRRRRLLFGQRNPNRIKAGSALSGHGQWTMPGGKLDFGERFENGATREVLEETGLMIDPNSLRVITLNNHLIDNTLHFITIGMLYEADVGEPRVTEPDVITRWDWFALDALPKPLYLPSLYVLNNYRQKLFYWR